MKFQQSAEHVLNTWAYPVVSLFSLPEVTKRTKSGWSSGLQNPVGPSCVCGCVVPANWRQKHFQNCYGKIIPPAHSNTSTGPLPAKHSCQHNNPLPASPARGLRRWKIHLPMQEMQNHPPALGRSIGGGPGNPPQFSCLENLVDRGAWQLQSMVSQRAGCDWAFHCIDVYNLFLHSAVNRHFGHI